MKMMLCGGRKKCCPSIEELGNGVTISDDYGGLVILTKKEFKELQSVRLDN